MSQPEAAPPVEPLADYQATIRRSEIAMPALIGVAMLAGLVVTGVVLWADGPALESSILVVAAATVAGLLWCLAMAFRVHRWTATGDGVVIHERPKLPLTGLSHRALVRWPDIVAFRDVESGFDFLIEIVTRDGRRYRMAQTMVQEKGKRLLSVDPNARLGDFVASLQRSAARAGHPLPATTQGFSFWNTVPGLAFVGFLLALSLAISAVVVFALLEGFTTRQPRGGEALAILLLLPVGAFWLLRRLWRRRRVVLESLRQSRPLPR